MLCCISHISILVCCAYIFIVCLFHSISLFQPILFINVCLFVIEYNLGSAFGKRGKVNRRRNIATKAEWVRAKEKENERHKTEKHAFSIFTESNRFVCSVSSTLFVCLLSVVVAFLFWFILYERGSSIPLNSLIL